jgi:catechol 2,3-dioxygenase-like lactoylglutathione lyase family enzyme
MLIAIIPRLPMLHVEETIKFYTEKMSFQLIANYGNYLLFEKDGLELHFFLHTTLKKETNESGVYLRIDDAENLYQDLKAKAVEFPDLGHLERKPWGQLEFAVLDNNGNLLTFGQTN